MHTKIHKLFLMVVLLMALPLSAAQATADIAVINIQDIMRDSLAAKSVKQKLEDQQKSFQDEMTKKEKDLQNKEQNLAGLRSTLSPQEFEKQVKDFRESAGKAQRDVQAKKAKLDKAFAEALNKIQETVTDIAKEIAKEKGVSVIMPTSQLLYANQKLDITQDVLTQLNKKLPQVSVKF